MEILGLILGSTGLLGVAVLIFRTGRIVEKIDTIASAVNALKISLDSLKEEMRGEFKEIRKDISAINTAVARLETRAEERILRVVHSQAPVVKAGTPPHDGEGVG